MLICRQALPHVRFELPLAPTQPVACNGGAAMTSWIPAIDALRAADLELGRFAPPAASHNNDDVVVSRVVDDRSPPTRRPQVRRRHAVVGIDAATRRPGSPRAPRQRPAFGCSVLRPELAATRQAGRASPRVGLVREAQRSTFVVQCGPHRGVWAASSKGQTTDTGSMLSTSPKLRASI